jgi:dGTPase
MSDEIFQAMSDLRAFMFKSVYTNPVAKGEEIKARRMIKELFEYYAVHPEDMPERFQTMNDEGTPLDRTIADYISGMTDQYAVTKFNEYFMPKAWEVDGY